MIPEPVRMWFKEQGYGNILSSHPVGGGCINHNARLQSSKGRTFFLKTNWNTPPDMFAREAEGLRELSEVGELHVPRVFLHGDDFLLLEDLAPASRRPDYWTTFGWQLAALHNHTNSKYGFLHDNYIGSTPQPNPWTDDGFAFFAEHRLLYQARLAHQRGLLSKANVGQVEQFAVRLPELVPAQPASLIHGDLWSGNAMMDAEGQPAVIDPAAHYGWAEAELGMTTLFGSFADAFYRAYQEVRPLEWGYQERFSIYNLYHLLNHLNLFGGNYRGQVLAILRRYQ